MALPLPPGLTHAEVAFLAEMELVTVVPRQRLESIELLGGKTPPLRPPHRTDLPLWLALLLKKQRRANIVPPPWLHPSSLAEIIKRETKENPTAFSDPPPAPARADPSRPGIASRGGRDHNYYDEEEDGNSGGDVILLSAPFRPSCTADAPAGYLPYHWLEVAESLLAHAGDDVASLGATPSSSSSAGEVRGLLRDLVEVRAAKMRSSTSQLEGFGGGLMSLRGVGAMELAESRGFTEAARREEEEERGDDDEEEEEDDRVSDEEMGI
ncbi:GINS complex protein-domain-containing protein [Chaetomium strumarium]|uniref:DNA replication complex GINS protein PSF2 n=1 Tax=Chaetomium strumarium TaxID=1170767 RepID=A0AAJ0GVQ6_9PEZI|nr:GINS complex protein-domain-containing protein [Chaetomium strumarium]